MQFHIVVGKCLKSNRYVIFQVEKTGFEEGKVLGCAGGGATKIYDSQIFVKKLIAKDPCPSCGANVSGACKCAAATCNGSAIRFPNPPLGIVS